ncbi:type IX secretion system sortase PorU [candidate division KSB1 bacterium]|nr:type IX secretion system sortase PorU [candidate division KSB1 bacterium]
MQELKKSFLIILTFGFIAMPAQISAGLPDDCTILSSSDRHVTIEFKPQGWRTDSTMIDGKPLVKVYFLGAEIIAEPGELQLPTRTLLVGVPQQGNITATLAESDYKVIPTPALQTVPQVLRSEDLTEFKYTLAPRGGDTYSQSVLRLGEPYVFRGQRVVKVIVYPLQIINDTETRKYQRLVITVNFAGDKKQSGSAVSAKNETIYRDLLVNYQQARQWRTSVSERLFKKAQKTFDGGPWYKVIIRGDGRGGLEGMYKIDAATLSRAGISVASIDPRTIRLFNNGGMELPQNHAVPRADSLIENSIFVYGEDDGIMDSGDYILFYGRSLEGVQFVASEKKWRHYLNHYGYENVYWLTYGGENGKRMASRSSLSPQASPEPSFRDLVFMEEERNNIYKSGIEWFGFEFANEKRNFSHTFVLPAVSVADEVSFRFQIAAATSGYHNMKLYANGNYLGRLELFGQGGAFTIKSGEFNVAGVLMQGNNNISAQYESSSDITQAYMDWIEIEYNRFFHAAGDQLLFTAPLRAGTAVYQIDQFTRDDISVYDVTDFYDVTQITNGTIVNRSATISDYTDEENARRYLALTPAAYRSVSEIRAVTPANLRTPRMVDYIIITHDNFYQQAIELESLREDYDPDDRLITEVVKISDVYNEFAWGLIDPTAIRDFLMYAQNHWGGPGYVLLLGDGHFDFRDILKYGTPNLIPPYESSDRIETSTRAVDDWFTYTQGSSYGMQMAIGRLPVQTVDEAQAVVNKIVEYETTFEPGEWRKTIALMADDELGSGARPDVVDHTRQTEWLAEHYVPNLLNVEKIYLMEYPAVRTASVSGITKPLANEALLTRINEGCLVLNFIGHGNDELWTHERVLHAPNDFDMIQNKGRYNLWVAATCEFAYWDQPQKQSLAERLLNVADRGAVALVASSRLAYSGDNAAFNYMVFDKLFKTYQSSGLTARLGDAVMLAKETSSSSQINNEKFILLGDPAMRLGAPQYRAVVDQITPEDTLRALMRMGVQGHMSKENQSWDEFNGKLILRVFDARKQQQYITAEGIKVDYIMPGNTLFRGYAEGQAGQYNVQFIVPKDISYGGTDGRISLYGWNGDEEASGFLGSLVVGGTAVDLVDHDGPEIFIHFGKEGFSAGDYTSPNPLLHVVVNDSLSGVNIAGDIGHQIAMSLDGADPKNVTEYFQYDTGSYTRGVLKYQMHNLSVGQHTISVKAWDNSNNSNYIETYFTVVADSTLKIRNVLNYPNPMHNRTQFTYELSQDARVTIQIYSVAGRLLRKLPQVWSTVGFNVYPEYWDGTDADGDPLANGVYLYRVHAENDGGTERVRASEIGKVIVMR